MENLFSEGNLRAPTLDFNADTGIFEIKGRSLPEHAFEFFKPVLDWLDEYSKQHKPVTVLNVSLEYFNTSSSKMILEIFKKLNDLSKQGMKLEINWFYEDDDPDMLEQGETIRDIIKVPVNIIPVKSFNFTYSPD